MANTRCFRSVCMCHEARGEEKRTEETSSCDSWQSINVPEQLFSQLRSWMLKLVTSFVCVYTESVKNVSFLNMPLCFMLPFSTAYCMLLWAHGCTDAILKSVAKSLISLCYSHIAITVSCVFSYTTTKHQKTLHDGSFIQLSLIHPIASVKKFMLHTFWGFLFNSLTFRDLDIITFISHILQTCVENLALLKSTLNHQAPLFCCRNHGPFWNLISWSRGSRVDAILYGIIEVFFPLHVCAVVFVISLPCPLTDGRVKACWRLAESPPVSIV